MLLYNFYALCWQSWWIIAFCLSACLSKLTCKLIRVGHCLVMIIYIWNIFPYKAAVSSFCLCRCQQILDFHVIVSLSSHLWMAKADGYTLTTICHHSTRGMDQCDVLVRQSRRDVGNAIFISSTTEIHTCVPV